MYQSPKLNFTEIQLGSSTGVNIRMKIFTTAPEARWGQSESGPLIALSFG